MPTRELPARPNLDHLKNEAKALQHAFQREEPGALERVRVILGERTELKLTEAQRVVAREYGFASWAKLRSHVHATRGVEEAVGEFLAAVEAEDGRRAESVLQAQPDIASASPHVAAALGRADELRSILVRDPTAARARAGSPPAEPLLVACFSPFHGESPERDEGLAASVRLLLEAGANPNTVAADNGIPVLYAVTGHRNVPRIARMLLEAGANPTDGESAFHAAEHFHLEALELLREFGVDLNSTGGGWGNTPLYFLLHWFHVHEMEKVQRGFFWLLDHGADPNVLCGQEHESSLHVGVRKRQHPEVIKLLLEHGADVSLRSRDGRTAWVLSKRAGVDAVTALLEEAGAEPEPLTAEDQLLEACASGDKEAARRLASKDLLASLHEALRQLLHDSARRGDLPVVRACLASGFPPAARDENDTTALHYACIEGHSAVVSELLAHGADFSIRDKEHHGTPLAWACFGSDFNSPSDGDFEGCARALLEAGSRLTEQDHHPRNPRVLRVLREFGAR